jgi:hypothetical protein
VRRPTKSAASPLGPAVVVALTLCLIPRGSGESLDGCMGAPPNATSLSMASVVFVWPCYVAGDTFLAPDPRDVEFERDRQLRAQFR